MKSRLVSVCAFALLLASFLSPTCAFQYEAIVLDILPGSTYARALDINDQGQIVGTCRVGYRNHAVMWDKTGAISVIASVSDMWSSSAVRINNLGHILIGIDSLTSLHSCVLATSDSIIRMYPVAGAEVGMISLNDRDQIVGYENNRDTYINLGVFWDGDSVQYLMPGSVADVFGGEPADINNSGWAAGYFCDAQNYLRDQACLWRSPNEMEYLLSGSESLSQAIAINDMGQVIGWATPYEAEGGTFLWQDGHYYYLTLPGDKNMLTANDINNKAQIVGHFGLFTDDAPAPTETCDAFIWQDDVFYALPSPYLYGEALAVNNNGWAVGWACNSVSSSDTEIIHPMLWMPVPEPGSLCAVAFGLIALALAKRCCSIRMSRYES